MHGFIIALSRIDRDERKTFIDQAQQLFTKDMDVRIRSYIVRGLASVKRDDRTPDFINKVKESIEKQTSAKTILNKILALAYDKAQERGDTEPLFDGECEIERIVTITE